jgi:hypothetical protein
MIEKDTISREDRGIRDNDLFSKKVKVATKVERKTNRMITDPYMLSLTCDFSWSKSLSWIILRYLRS